MTDSFDCDNCKESLYGRKYIQSDDSPYCIPCYDNLFSNTCDECKELIGHDARELFYEDRHYHEHCFRCFRCDHSLADEPFTSQDDELLCNDCYCNEFSSKCVACDKVVMPGTRKLEYAGSTWHEGCFICNSCNQPIGSKSFIPDKDEHYCVTCYEDKFAPRCTRCKKTLAKGGVTYRDEPWHKECFVCTSCKTQLAGQHFTSRDENPYCLKCFGSLYSKKCEACSKPITGFGGGSTSHLRNVSGTSPASPAPSARLHWWAPAFSLMETRSCAATATPTATYKQCLTPLPPFPDKPFTLCHSMLRTQSHYPGR
ncbi:four and a half LIM domains protein 3 isoform X1 [Eleginops maclovinus]